MVGRQSDGLGYCVHDRKHPKAQLGYRRPPEGNEGNAARSEQVATIAQVVLTAFFNPKMMRSFPGNPFTANSTGKTTKLRVQEGTNLSKTHLAFHFVKIITSPVC